MGPTISMGLLQLGVLRQNPPAGSAPLRENSVRDKATQRVASSWRYSRPYRGHPTSSSFVSESWPGGFLHALAHGLASSRPGSPDRDYLGMSHETTWPRFDREGICPCLVLWRGTCPCRLSPAHGDPDSTEILTRHHSAKSHTVSQVVNTGTTPTRQVPGSSAPSCYRST
jgi:hypothetical protein